MLCVAEISQQTKNAASLIRDPSRASWVWAIPRFHVTTGNVFAIKEDNNNGDRTRPRAPNI
jgi:hypothetical protein